MAPAGHAIGTVREMPRRCQAGGLVASLGESFYFVMDVKNGSVHMADLYNHGITYQFNLNFALYYDVIIKEDKSTLVSRFYYWLVTNLSSTSFTS